MAWTLTCGKGLEKGEIHGDLMSGWGKASQTWSSWSSENQPEEHGKGVGDRNGLQEDASYEDGAVAVREREEMI